MKRSSTPITVRVGRREFVKLNVTKYDWRDIYNFILTLSWPQFAGLLLGIYVLFNLCFATLYLLGGRCIAGLVPGSFSDAFFFSVETLATVGYGHAYPDTLYGHCIATLEIMVGLFGLAVMTGMIFVRFSRPTARIKFSSVAVVAPFDGFPTLMIRLVNLRHHAMVEAEFRLLLMRNELTKEREDVRRFYPLRLQFEHVINFAAALTLRHVIDETSPLFGLDPQALKLADSRMLASVVCVDPVMQAPVQSQNEYLHEQIAWNRRFAEIYTEDRKKMPSSHFRENRTPNHCRFILASLDDVRGLEDCQPLVGFNHSTAVLHVHVIHVPMVHLHVIGVGDGWDCS